MNQNEEWKRIAIYNSGKADMILTILEHFRNEATSDTVQFMNVERELALERKAEAEAKIKA